jgi:hypothetical protein
MPPHVVPVDGVWGATQSDPLVVDMTSTPINGPGAESPGSLLFVRNEGRCVRNVDHSSPYFGFVFDLGAYRAPPTRYNADR